MVDEKTVRLGSIRPIVQAPMLANAEDSLFYGRKRHILVDTLGLLLLVVVHSAGTQVRDRARAVLAPLANCFSKLRKIWADSIYNGGIVEWAKNLYHSNRLDLEIVKRPEGVKGFLVLARCWVIELTFARFSFHRRLSKGY